MTIDCINYRSISDVFLINEKKIFFIVKFLTLALTIKIK